MRPEITFGADIIAGFPTETDEHFESSINLIKDCGLTWLHIFPYSPRDGTPAARMPQVNGNQIKRRAAILRDLGTKQIKSHLSSQLGKDHSILMENCYMGRTEQFTEVKFDKEQTEGSIVLGKITDANEKQLFATAI
jgi:threonylcarbamoyladenosine tRNA methylthiotransferase MtaB